MFCNNCGAQIANDSKKSPECSAEILQKNQENVKRVKPKKKKIIIIISIILIAAILIGMLCFNLFKRRSVELSDITEKGTFGAILQYGAPTDLSGVFQGDLRFGDRVKFYGYPIDSFQYMKDTKEVTIRCGQAFYLSIMNAIEDDCGDYTDFDVVQISDELEEFIYYYDYNGKDVIISQKNRSGEWESCVIIIEF